MTVELPVDPGSELDGFVGSSHGCRKVSFAVSVEV